MQREASTSQAGRGASTIELAGYTARDKAMLALRHIVPAAVIELGLAAGSLGFTDATIDTLVGEYSAEPGALARAKPSP